MSKATGTDSNYTKIPNEVLEELARIRIAGESMQILHVIMRKTLGFHKKGDAISLSQFCLATGLRKPSIIRAIKKLIQLNIIYQKVNATANKYSINKDFSTWKPFTKKITFTKKRTDVYQKVNNRLPKSNPQKKVSKESIKRKHSESFSLFWEAYPLKVKEAAALENWTALNPDEHLIETILSALEKYKRSEKWQDKNFIPHAINWLKNKQWKDEVPEEQTVADRYPRVLLDDEKHSKISKEKLEKISSMNLDAFNDIP